MTITHGITNKLCGAASIALAAIICATIGLRAEAETPAPHEPVRSFLEMRNQGVIHQQWDLSCGAATLATLLAFQHSDPVPEPQIAKAMLERTDVRVVNQRGGFSLLDLKQYVQGRGYQGMGYAGLTVEDLEGLAPIIVPVSLSKIEHFVVFRGRIGDRVVLADPAYGNRVMRSDRFESVWHNKVGFVVTKQGAPSPNGLAVNADSVNVVTDPVLRAAIR